MALSGWAGALSVSGTTPPWISEVGGRSVRFVQRGGAAALHELYSGRVSVALLSLPAGKAPPGVGPLSFTPVGVYAARLAYRLPGLDLRLDLGTACRIFAGEIRVWNDPQIVALNNGAALPSLPILTVARSDENAASRAFADACVLGGWWPPQRQKNSWSAASVNLASSGVAQREVLALTGSLGILGPLEDVPGLQSARLRTMGGSFAPPSPTLGLAKEALPKKPDGALPLALEPGAYPLRGLVWAAALREQAYRGRTRQNAQDVAAFITALQAAPSSPFAALPPALRPSVKLTFEGKELDQPSVTGATP